MPSKQARFSLEQPSMSKIGMFSFPEWYIHTRISFFNTALLLHTGIKGGSGDSLEKGSGTSLSQRCHITHANLTGRERFNGAVPGLWNPDRCRALTGDDQERTVVLVWERQPA